MSWIINPISQKWGYNMDKKIIIAVLAIVIIVIGSAAVVMTKEGKGNSGGDNGQVDTGEDYPRTVKDFTGTDVVLEKKPERVVAASVEYLVYLGQDVVDRIVWAGHNANFPEERGVLEAFGIEDKCTLKGNIITQIDAILEKKPDLVLIHDSGSSGATAADREQFRDTLAKAGIDVYIYTVQSNLYSNSKECLEVNLMPIAEIFAEEDRAQELIDFIDDETKNLEEILAGVDATDQKNVYVAGGAGKARGKFLGGSPTTYHPMLYLDDYAHNIMYDITQEEYKVMEFEELYQYERDHGDIDVIFINITAYADFLGLYKENPNRFSPISTFGTGEVYVITDWFPRAYMGLGNAYLIGQYLYPDAFDFDVDEYLMKYMVKFYGSEEAAKIVYDTVIENISDKTGQTDVSLLTKVDLSRI